MPAAAPPAVTQLRLPAGVNHARANACTRALREALRLSRGAPVVRVDAGALEHFDSSVLAVLLECRRDVVSMGWQFEVERLPECLRKLAGLYGVAELLPAG